LRWSHSASVSPDQLQYEEAIALGFLQPVNRSYIRMIQRRQHPRFSLKARQTFQISCKFGG
jgi:c-di-GMP-binding flagellar brake protein YcgR